MNHELKIWPPMFRLVESGAKAFEVRLNDRDYRAGDTLTLREWDNIVLRYTGRTLRRRITYVMAGPQFGVEMGYVVLSLAEIGAGDA